MIAKTHIPHVAIAIDGPAASGKSTIARHVAARLGFVMVNSGEMYRAVTWKVIQMGLDPSDAVAVVKALDRMELKFGYSDGCSHVAVDGILLKDALHGDDVNAAVARVSAVPEVRSRLVAAQRDFLSQTSLVMEGRDIGTVVFPDTPYKIYVDASEEVRQARRSAEGQRDAVAVRDQADRQRATAPLQIAAGAIVLDNSQHTVESAVEAALSILAQQGLKWE